MAKKRHWKKKAKIQERVTENAKLSESVENTGLISAKTSDAVKDNMQNHKDNADDKLLCTIDVSGEKCLEIDCGSNKAMLYLSKMCLGSKGACIQFKGAWLTPNEFQFVSGRENAKDWKRSIRHNGSSLKLLLAKNLIKIQTSPKKVPQTSEEKENNEQLSPKLSTMKVPDDRRTETDTGSNTTPTVTGNDGYTSATSSLVGEIVGDSSAALSLVGETVGDRSATQSAVTETAGDTVCDTEMATERSCDDQQIGVTETEMSVNEISSDKETNLAKTDDRTTEGPLQGQSPDPVPEIVTEPALEPNQEPTKPEPEPTNEKEPESNIELEPESTPVLEQRPTLERTEEIQAEPIVDTTEDCNEATETDMHVEDERAQYVLPAPTATKRAKRRKKKGTKRGWGRQKSRTSGQGHRSRQPSPALDDLPVEEIPLAYDSLTEEDKLAVFVKALRLARKRDLPEPIANIPEPVKPVHDHLRSHGDLDDREMPVLEREVDLVVPNPAIQPSHPNIFPSTVTPPPTPPLTESPDIDEIKRELKTIDQTVFESRLSPVEDGIKLKINRLCDEGLKAKESKIDTVKQEIKPESVHNNLVVDTKRISGPVTEIHSLNTGHPTSTILSENTFSNVKSSGSSAVSAEFIKSTDNILKQEPVVDSRTSETATLMPDFTSAKQHNKTVPCPVKPAIKQENLANGGISMVQTPYGPMLMPTEENIRIYHELLAAYSTIQHSLTQTYTLGNVRKACSSGSKTVGSTCSAAAQQLSVKTAYQQGKSALFEGPNFQPRNSLVNVQRNNPVNINPQRLNTHSMKYEHTDRNSVHVTKYEYMKRNGISTHVPQSENMYRKRKSSECKVALDLSTKKPKVETFAAPTVAKVPQRYDCVTGPQESPLDFSMKKPVYTNSMNHTCSTSVGPTYNNSVKPLNYVHKQNFVSPVHRNNSDQGNQLRTNASSNPLLNKVSAQTAKSSNPTNNQNVNNKSAYNSLWNCVRRQLDKDMSKWTVEQVCLFLGCLDGCGDYMQVFRDQGISGKLLPYLTTQHLTRTLGMNVGPALTLQYAIGRFFKDSANPNHLSSRARVSV